ncbi:unnamed protein product, partial [Linum tenue]
MFVRATAIPPFEVKVTDGNFLLCERCYEAVQIEIQGVQLRVDLYELPRCGIDVNLGGQWLKQASPISFDWRNATMHFKDKGSWVTLQGAINPDDEGTAADRSLRDNDAKLRKTGCRNRGGQPSLQARDSWESMLKRFSAAIDVVLPATTSPTSRVIAPPPPVGTLTMEGIALGMSTMLTSQDPTSPAPCVAIRLKGGRQFYW